MFNQRFAIISALVVVGCGSSGSPEDPSFADGPSAPVATSPMVGQGLYATVYVFGDTEDATPSTLSFTNGTGAISCAVVLPGVDPMTPPGDGSVNCTDAVTTDGFVVSGAYPAGITTPRAAESPTEPPSAPMALPENCQGATCSTTGREFDPAPEFPHVRFHILAKTDAVPRVELAVSGNGRSVSIPINLSSDPDVSGPYLNVDDAPTDLGDPLAGQPPPAGTQAL